MNGTGNVWKAGTHLATEPYLVQQLQNFFLGKGMHEAGTFDNSHRACFIYSGDNRMSAVRILEEDELSSRNSVLDAILSTASLMNRFNYVYLALPKLISSMIESKIIEEHGIGLIVYDQKTVQEVVNPKYLQIMSQQPTISVPNQESQALLEEISALRGRLKFLEETMESLKSEIGHLKSWKTSVPHLTGISSSPTTPVFEGAPSFIRDNPWIDVLSKRGSESERLVS
jgi:hypothetical protein